MSKRCRLTAERWQELIDRQRASGLGVKAFCQRHGLAPSTFFAWRRKLRAAAPAFVELTGEPEAAGESDSMEGHDAGALATGPPIELALPSGVIARVYPGFDAGTLRRIVEALS